MEDYLNENEVIEGVINYFKGHGYVVDKYADAKTKEQGIDIYAHAESNKRKSSRFFVEAKGDLKAIDNSKKKTRFNTDFRWVISQIILRMQQLPHLYSANYGIAVPRAEKKVALDLMRRSKGLKLLKVRLYFAYRKENGELYAEEWTTRRIYSVKTEDESAQFVKAK